MATNLLPVGSVHIRACSTRHGKPENHRRNQAPNWWTPIFGWSSEPDYIDSTRSKPDLQHKSNPMSVSSGESPKTLRARFAPGSFTEEKARHLRLKTMETETFHDAMYHSAIASRLASDFKSGSNM